MNCDDDDDDNDNDNDNDNDDNDYDIKHKAITVPTSLPPSILSSVDCCLPSESFRLPTLCKQRLK